MQTNERAEAARKLIRREKHGVISTISKKLDGWPFGSLVSYAILDTGEPILLLSGLAEHTRNIHEDARVSLFLQDSGAREDPQAGARLVIVGTAERIGDERLDVARVAYLARFPESSGLLQLGDFAFYTIKMMRAQFIAGFGQIGWLSGDDLTG